MIVVEFSYHFDLYQRKRCHKNITYFEQFVYVFVQTYAKFYGPHLMRWEYFEIIMRDNRVILHFLIYLKHLAPLQKFWPIIVLLHFITSWINSALVRPHHLHQLVLLPAARDEFSLQLSVCWGSIHLQR